MNMLLFILFFGLFGSVFCTVSIPTPIQYEINLRTNVSYLPKLRENVHIYTKHGQKFTCLLPHNKVVSEAYESEPVTNAFIQSTLKGINKKCRLFANGWWTYEVCFKQQVTQFRLEPMSTERTSVSVLGIYAKETDWSIPPTLVDLYHHSEYYEGGTLCDMTGMPRTTEVQYVCGEQDTVNILSMEEVETCNYLFRVSVPKLCSHPKFQLEAPPMLERITCLPLSVFEAVVNTTEQKSDFYLPRALKYRVVRQAGFLRTYQTSVKLRNRSNRRSSGILIRTFFRTLLKHASVAPLPDYASAINTYLRIHGGHILSESPLLDILRRVEYWVASGVIQETVELLDKTNALLSLRRFPLTSAKVMNQLMEPLLVLMSNFFAHTRGKLIPIYNPPFTLYRSFTEYNLLIRELLKIKDDAIDDRVLQLKKQFEIISSNDVYSNIVAVHTQTSKPPVTSTELDNLYQLWRRLHGKSLRLDGLIDVVPLIPSDDRLTAATNLLNQLKSRLNLNNLKDGSDDMKGVFKDFVESTMSILSGLPMKHINDMELVVFEGSGKKQAVLLLGSDTKKKKEEGRMKDLENAYNFRGKPWSPIE